MDFRDWFILGLVSLNWLAATVYMFLFHSPEVFVAWCGLATTIGGVYHWIVVRDAKVKDAE